MPHQFARTLRKHPTDAEQNLWRELRYMKLQGFHFRRQVPIGPYVADFICHSAKLIIELDGGQHNEPEDIAYDRRRTSWLGTQGYQVIRFWNNDVLRDAEAVHTVIRHTLGLDRPPTRNASRVSTSPRGGGKE